MTTDNRPGQRHGEVYSVLEEAAVQELCVLNGTGLPQPEGWPETRIELLKSLTNALFSKHYHRKLWDNAKFRAECRRADKS